MSKHIFNIFAMFNSKPLPVVNQYPTPDISRTRSRSNRIGKARSRLKLEYTAWYKHLSQDQKDYHRATWLLTNHQLTVWNRGGCLGHENMDITLLLPFLHG